MENPMKMYDEQGYPGTPILGSLQIRNVMVWEVQL